MRNPMSSQIALIDAYTTKASDSIQHSSRSGSIKGLITTWIVWASIKN